MDPLSLFTALVWGAIGFGFFIYGKKRDRLVPLAGGILLMASSYVVHTPLALSISGIVLVAGIYILNKRL